MAHKERTFVSDAGDALVRSESGLSGRSSVLLETLPAHLWPRTCSSSQRVSLDIRREYLQQSIILALLIWAERDSMDILLLGGEFQIHEFHVFLSSKAYILHQRLKKRFCTGIPDGQLPCNLLVEHLWLFNTAGDVEELDQRLQVLDGIDTGAGQQKIGWSDRHARTLEFQSRPNETWT